MKIKVGDAAPEFSLPDQNGELHSLAETRGSWTLVYFYPKDDTPGCTKEACSIGELFPAFEKIDAKVFGISVDPVKSHKKFAEKYELPFTLLSDEKKEVVDSYGVWQEKQMMGRTFMGTVRTSFLLDPRGTVAKVYEKVKPELHAEEVLADIKAFQKAVKDRFH